MNNAVFFIFNTEKSSVSQCLLTMLNKATDVMKWTYINYSIKALPAASLFFLIKVCLSAYFPQLLSPSRDPLHSPLSCLEV